jgi:Fe-S cluster assembly protein SufB
MNSAVWSGGSFVYIPKGVELDTPLQAYFRVNQEQMGQFERTLIIADEGSKAHYIEGCTAPVYSTESFHSGVIEIVVKPGAHFRYTTIQNWSNNMYNLVTQRALVHENATMEWLDGNLGSKLTMKYPSCYLDGRGRPRLDPLDRLRGERAAPGHRRQGDPRRAEHHLADRLEVDLEGDGALHLPRALQGARGCGECPSNVECDALLINDTSRTDTYPYIEIEEKRSNIGHEATVSKVGDEQLFYLMSRGMSEEEAMALIVRGFIEPIAKLLRWSTRWS